MIIELEIRTGTRSELVDITPQIQDTVKRASITEGICLISVPHTTAGLTLNENWDPSVKEDLLRGLDQMAPALAAYRHAEGNSTAHLKATLVGFSVMVPIDEGALLLGAWQGIYLAEFDGPRPRHVLIQILSGSE